jgi:hypothetical protein
VIYEVHIDNVVYRIIARQQLGKNILAEPCARSSRTSLARQSIRTSLLNNREAVFSAWTGPRDKEGHLSHLSSELSRNWSSSGDGSLKMVDKKWQEYSKNRLISHPNTP